MNTIVVIMIGCLIVTGLISLGAFGYLCRSNEKVRDFNEKFEKKEK